MPKSSGVAPRRILIVEDEAMIAFTLAELLADEGFGVIGPVGTRPEALFALEHAHPDVVVLDLGLRDGLCAALLAEIHARDIPFIVFSGYPRHAFGWPELQGVPWFEKPGHAEEIVGALAHVVAVRRRQLEPG